MSSPAPPQTAPASRTAQRQRSADDFVQHVVALCARDKGAQAALRTGRGRPVDQCGRLHRYVAWRISRELFAAEQERAFYAVAALIAARPRRARDDARTQREADESAATEQDAAPQDREVRPAESPVEPRNRARLNLGVSLAHAVRLGVLKEESAENRLHLLTRQSSASVHPRLPALVDQLTRGGVAVDWAVLLTDLAYWDRDRDRIATRWLQSFYRTLHASPRLQNDPDTSGNDSEESEKH